MGLPLLEEGGVGATGGQLQVGEAAEGRFRTRLRLALFFGLQEGGGEALALLEHPRGAVQGLSGVHAFAAVGVLLAEGFHRFLGGGCGFEVSGVGVGLLVLGVDGVLPGLSGGVAFGVGLVGGGGGGAEFDVGADSLEGGGRCVFGVGVGEEVVVVEVVDCLGGGCGGGREGTFRHGNGNMMVLIK